MPHQAQRATAIRREGDPTDIFAPGGSRKENATARLLCVLGMAGELASSGPQCLCTFLHDAVYTISHICIFTHQLVHSNVQNCTKVMYVHICIYSLIQKSTKEFGVRGWGRTSVAPRPTFGPRGGPRWHKGRRRYPAQACIHARPGRGGAQDGRKRPGGPTRIKPGPVSSLVLAWELTAIREIYSLNCRTPLSQQL